MSKKTWELWTQLDCPKAADCLDFLSYLALERPEEQSLRIFERETGIPYSSLRDILTEAADPETRNSCMLRMIGTKYGFDYVIFQGWRDHDPHRVKKLIDVVKLPYDNTERWGNSGTESWEPTTREGDESEED